MILISSAAAAVVLFALTMFRVASLSDDSHAVAVAEWIATTYLAERNAPSAERGPERNGLEDPGDAYRRTG